jgi:hypothetical protein
MASLHVAGREELIERRPQGTNRGALRSVTEVPALAKNRQVVLIEEDAVSPDFVAPGAASFHLRYLAVVE